MDRSQLQAHMHVNMEHLCLCLPTAGLVASHPATRWTVFSYDFPGFYSTKHCGSRRSGLLPGFCDPGLEPICQGTTSPTQGSSFLANKFSKVDLPWTVKNRRCGDDDAVTTPWDVGCWRMDMIGSGTTRGGLLLAS